MADRIDYDAMTRMLLAAVERIRGARESLSTLDAATGDGDHGAAMCKVADAIAKTIDGRNDRDLAALLSEIGWAAMGTDAGSTGPLYGSLFVGMSEKAGGTEPLDVRGFACMLEAGVVNLRSNTKAKPGDKTMIDALVPAIEAVRAAADAGRSLMDALDHTDAGRVRTRPQHRKACGRSRGSRRRVDVSRFCRFEGRVHEWLKPTASLTPSPMG